MLLPHSELAIHDLIARQHIGVEYNEHNTVSYVATDPYISPYEINSLPRSYRESMI